MTSYALIALINFCFVSGLAAFVFFTNPTNRLNQTYTLANISVAAWSYFYFCWQTASTYQSAFINLQLLMCGAAFMPVFLFHFISIYVNKEESLGRTLIGVYSVGLVFVSLIFNGLLFSVLRQKGPFMFWPDAGIALLPFILYFFVIIAGAMCCYIKIYLFRTSSAKEEQNIYSWAC